MSKSPSPSVLDPCGRCRQDLDRAERVRYVRAVAAMRMARSDDEASLFVGGALLAWLAEGGDLAQDSLRLTAEQAPTLPRTLSPPDQAE